MRIPLEWLADYVDLAPDIDPAEVQAALVRVGFEEEALHESEFRGPLVVGEILDFEEETHKNGKTVRWCSVRVAPEGQQAADGGDDVRGIVCGARNFERGDKVVVSLPGAILPGPFPISARKTYGHVSDGMIASRRELTLGDDHDGILRLREMNLDPLVGTDALDLLDLGGTAIEINVTPDRGYAFSLRGVAREYSHATGAAFRDPVDLVPATRGNGFGVSLVDRSPIRGREGCAVYVTRVVRGVDASRSAPLWMQSRLRLAGIRPISLIVDVTNYVMLECGQPLHAYDLDRVVGEVTVRRAEAGERLVTLDEKDRVLDVDDLVVADEYGPLGLAGIMGGARTEIRSESRDILIEAAHFDPVSVARSVRRHKIPSEAAKRFERGVDPSISEAAAARAVEFLVTLGGGVADSLGSFTGALPELHTIDLPGGFVSRLIGVDYSQTDIRHALETIGSTVEGSSTDGAVRVTTPSWRPDLRDAASLAEEVARIAGYDRIPAQFPGRRPRRGIPRDRRLRRAAGTVLAANGMSEIRAYPFVSIEQSEAFPPIRDGVSTPIRLANPLDRTHPFLRVSLVPGLLAIAHRNVARGLRDVAIYEEGVVFLPQPGERYGTPTVPGAQARPTDDDLAELSTSVPPQPRHLAGVFVGDAWTQQPGLKPEPFSWRNAITAVQQVAYAMGSPVRVKQGSHPSYHPGRTAVISLPSGEVIGYAGEILPRLATGLSLPRVVAAFEIDCDALVAAAPTSIRAQAIATKPAVVQDLSLLVGIDIPAGELSDLLAEAMGDLLEHHTVSDDYRGEGVPSGMKSLTFGLRFRATDRTLTAEEANAAKMRGVRAAEETFSAVLRDEK